MSIISSLNFHNILLNTTQRHDTLRTFLTRLPCWCGNFFQVTPSRLDEPVLSYTPAPLLVALNIKGHAKIDASREKEAMCGYETPEPIPNSKVKVQDYGQRRLSLRTSQKESIPQIFALGRPGVKSQHFKPQAKRLCISPDKRLSASESDSYQSHLWRPTSSWYRMETSDLTIYSEKNIERGWRNLNPWEKGELDLNVDMLPTREQILKIKEMLEVKNKKKGDMITPSRTSTLIVHTFLEKNCVVLLAVEASLTAPVKILLLANDPVLQKHQVNKRIIRVAI
ncbi:hypothetical protein HYALB_00009444 [Hymenoscyphus albidus]|uniref:Uncharacterized protein n=1 Tax=Hymenoscyphus albidus TaxID=595503 RepID=A0A9N9PXM3_9HELO|nr:hypothetical protein HYALB_00009444 [Hymenoscyphus albidus]